MHTISKFTYHGECEDSPEKKGKIELVAQFPDNSLPIYFVSFTGTNDDRDFAFDKDYIKAVNFYLDQIKKKLKGNIK